MILGPRSCLLENRLTLNQVISGRKANTTDKSTIPRIITLGGDHTTTLAALRSTYKRWGGEVSVIHFDSHLGRLPVLATGPLPSCLGWSWY